MVGFTSWGLCTCSLAPNSVGVFTPGSLSYHRARHIYPSQIKFQSEQLSNQNHLGAGNERTFSPSYLAELFFHHQLKGLIVSKLSTVILLIKAKRKRGLKKLNSYNKERKGQNMSDYQLIGIEVIILYPYTHSDGYAHSVIIP